MIGALFAWFARDRLRSDGAFSAPAFPLVAMFTGVLVMPTALYLYAAHNAWAWLYLVNPNKVPIVALIPLTVFHGLAVVLGWFGGANVLRRWDNPRIFFGILGGLATVFLVILVLARKRLFVSTSFDDFARGGGLPLFDVGLGYALLTIFALQLGAAAYISVELIADGGRARAR